MAILQIRPDSLAIELNRWERLGALHDSFTIPWSHIDRATAIKDLWPHVRGWRAPGTGLPHVILLGRMRYRDGKDFTAIYKSLPGVILELRDEPFRRILASTPDAQAIVNRVMSGP